MWHTLNETKSPFSLLSPSLVAQTPPCPKQAHTRPSQQGMAIFFFLFMGKDYWVGSVRGWVSVTGEWEVEWQSWPRSCFSSLMHVSGMAYTACWSFWRVKIWELVGEKLRSLADYSPPPTYIFNAPTLNSDLPYKQFSKTQEAKCCLISFLSLPQAQGSNELWNPLTLLNWKPNFANKLTGKKDVSRH